MLITEQIPLLRRVVSTNRMISLHRSLADSFGIGPGREVVIALLEVLDKGEISKMNDVEIKLLTDDIKPT